MPKYKLCLNGFPTVEYKKIEEIDNFFIKYNINNVKDLGNLFNVNEYEDYSFTIEYHKEVLKTIPILFCQDIKELHYQLLGSIYEYIYNTLKKNDEIEIEFIKRYVVPITHIEINRHNNDSNENKSYEHQKEMILVAKDIVKGNYDYEKLKRFLMFTINEFNNSIHQYQFSYKKIRDMYILLKYYDKSLPNSTIISKKELKEDNILDDFDEQNIIHPDLGLRMMYYDNLGNIIGSEPYAIYLERKEEELEPSCYSMEVTQKNKNL